MDIDLHHVQARHGLYGILDVLLNGGGYLRNAAAIIRDNVQIYSSLGLANGDLYTLTQVAFTQDLCNSPDKPAAHAGFLSKR